MALDHNEFRVARALLDGMATQRTLAERAHLGVATVNKALKSLDGRDLINEQGLTPKGQEELEAYKVDNAVIMAAGLSSRFVPLSYEQPKGLLKVRGQVLIERQIEQLIGAGIPKIYVVVGYKQELFFYLEDKYPQVTIVVNREYASRNNNSSLKAVEDKLANTYICSSDDYFEENPFEAYVWKSYYAAQYAQGETSEWVMTCGPHGRITKVKIGGECGWYMLGQVYFDREFSVKFREILDEEYDRPATAPKLWEELYIDHIGELDMRIRRYETPIIHEFDSLDDLREFDPLFLDNIDSDIIDNITAALGCSRTEIHDVYPLKESLTNLSCHFATNDGEYVYRHPGIGTENIINRQSELDALTAARDNGLDSTFICANPEEGWKISRFVPHATTIDVHSHEGLKQAMDVARKLHESDIKLESTFDFYREAKHYESLLLEKGPIQVPEYAVWNELAERVHAAMEQDDAPVTVTHNDFFYLNFLIEQDGTFNLIDWEYAGMGDSTNDLATFSVCCELSDEEVDDAIDLYYQGRPTPEERRHNLAMIGMCGWCWYCWSLLKESDGDFIGEWLYIYYRYVKKYLTLAAELYGLAGDAEKPAPAC